MYILNDWRKHKRVRTSGAQQPTHISYPRLDASYAEVLRALGTSFL